MRWQKTEYTFALDEKNQLYACFGRTVKYIFVNNQWKEVKKPEEYEHLFDYSNPTKFISSDEALKLTKNVEPKSYYSVHKRVYLTEEEINSELNEILSKNKYSENLKKLVMDSDIDTRVLILEWLIRSPNLHELTIEMLVKNVWKNFI